MSNDNSGINNVVKPGMIAKTHEVQYHLAMNDRPLPKVLVVDDDPSITNLVCTFLAGKGFLCDHATDGLEALRLCEEHTYAAIVSDVVMPGMNGLQLARELVKRNVDAPIMVMTGFGGENSAADALEAGAHEFIEKPFSLAVFDLRFQKMMRQHEILHLTREKQHEIQRISATMISGIEQDAYDNLNRLQKEIDALRARQTQ